MDKLIASKKNNNYDELPQYQAPLEDEDNLY
jgi:hypothetical protein